MRVFVLWREMTVWPQVHQGTVYDYVLPDGPLPDAQRVADFLLGGALLVATSPSFKDEVTGEPVLHSRDTYTDGTWAWDGRLAYYVRHRAVAPPSDLLHHIRASGHQPRKLSDTELDECTEQMMRLRSGDLALPAPMRQAMEALAEWLTRPGGPMSPEYAQWVRDFLDAHQPAHAWNLMINALQVDSGPLTMDDRQRLQEFADTAGYDLEEVG